MCWCAPQMDGIFPQPQLSCGPGTASDASLESAGRTPQSPLRQYRVRVAVDTFHASARDHGSGCSVARERDPPDAVATSCDPPERAPSGSGALHGAVVRLRFTVSVIGPNSTVPAVPKLFRPRLRVTAPSGIGKSRTQSVQSRVPAKPNTFGQPPTILPSLPWNDIGMRPFIHPGSFPGTRSVVFIRVRKVITPHSGLRGTRKRLPLPAEKAISSFVSISTGPTGGTDDAPSAASAASKKTMPA